MASPRLATLGSVTPWLSPAPYDVARVLDYLRQARPEPDERTAEAIDILEAKRDARGRWPLEIAYHDRLLVDVGEVVGSPSRWITLRALRVLRWAGREAGGDV